MNIETDKQYMVFNHEGKMSIGISKKNENGQYENAYLPVRFKGRIELADKTKIYIKKSFLTFSNLINEGKKFTYWYLMVLDFATVTEVIEEAKDSDPFKEFGEEINDEDLPF